MSPEHGQDVVDLGGDGSEALRHLAEGFAPVDRPERVTDRLARAVLVVGQDGDGSLARLTVGGGVREDRLLAVERPVLVGIDTPAASSSDTWNRSRSISRARARSSPPSAARWASIS
ncbi:MAG: hypothetical protein AAGF91_14925, partial [Actinomycetota bacterium]